MEKMDKDVVPIAKQTYCIGGYRTPLLSRIAGDAFWTHNSYFWHFFVQY